MVQLKIVCNFCHVQKVLLIAIIVTISTNILSVHAISSEDKSCQREAGVNACKSKSEKASVFSFMNGRNHMEDTFAMEENIGEPQVSLYGVFDGHGGDRAAKYTAKNLLVKMKKKLKEIRKNIRKRNEADYTNNSVINYEEFLKGEIKAFNDGDLQKELKKNNDESGTTAVVALITENQLYVANVGDSRAVLADIRGNAIEITEDHKPDSRKEWKRITALPHGSVELHYGTSRIMFYGEEGEFIGGMSTSRTLGDLPLKDVKFGFIADADTFNEDFSKEKSKFLIMATDGLWDAFKSAEAVNFINLRMKIPSTPSTSSTPSSTPNKSRSRDFLAKFIKHERSSPIEEDLAKEAQSKKSSDNITVMIIEP